MLIERKLAAATDAAADVEAANRDLIRAGQECEAVKRRIASAEQAAKGLESKIKVKKVLDFFQTQKSLDAAKRTLAETQEAVKAGKTQHPGFLKQFIHLTRSLALLKERLAVVGIARFCTTVIERETARTAEFRAEIERRGRMTDEFATEAQRWESWTVGDQKKRLEEISKRMKEMEKLQKDLDEIPYLVRKEWKKVAPAQVKDEVVRRTVTQAEEQIQGIKKLVSDARDLSLDVNNDTSLVLDRMELVSLVGPDGAPLGGDSAARARAEAATKSLRRIRMFAEMVESFNFENSLAFCKETLPVLANAQKNASRLTAEDWRKVDDLDSQLAAEGRKAASDHANLLRTEKSCKTIADTFGDQRDIQAAWQNVRDAAVRNKKKHADVQQAMGVLRTVLTKLLALPRLVGAS